MGRLRVDRVQFVIGQFGRGGSERQLALLANRLHQLGVRTSIVCLYPPRPELGFSQFETPGTPVVRPDRRFGRPVALAQLFAHTRRWRPQIVHSFSFLTNIVAWMLAESCNAISLGAVRSDLDSEWGSLGRVRRELCLRFPRLLVCNSHAAAEAVRRRRGAASPGSVVVLPNGIELDRFIPAARPSRPFVEIIGVGNLLEVKRWDRALRALASVRRAGVPARLTICGTGAGRPILEGLAAELGVAGELELPGNVSDVASRLASADVLIHCSRFEGSPNAVIEGMSAGLACVATEVGDVRKIMRDGETGLVARQDDDEDLAAKLERLCRDADLRRRLGAAARAHALAHFSIEDRVHDLVTLYSELLDRRRPSGGRRPRYA